MKLGTQGGARLAPYDRNPLVFSFMFGPTAIAPHAATQRATYSNPPQGRAVFELCSIVISRTTVAAPVGNSRSWIQLDDTAVAVTDLVRTVFNNNVIDSEVSAQRDSQLTLISNADVGYYTSDNSIGGTCTYTGAGYLYRFNA